MLVDPRFNGIPNPVAETIAIVNGREPGPERIDEGLFRIGHFSFDTLISTRGGNLHKEDAWEGFWSDDDLDVHGYGVCDSPEQFMEDVGHRLVESDGEFCVSFTHVEKAPGEGGWRWHKWGPYIGRGEPSCEYLADEEGFPDGVHVFHVFRRKR